MSSTTTNLTITPTTTLVSLKSQQTQPEREAKTQETESITVTTVENIRNLIAETEKSGLRISEHKDEMSKMNTKTEKTEETQNELKENEMTSEEEEINENEQQLTEEEIRKEIAEAFEVVKQCGRKDGRKIANLIANSYYEINGVEANISDLSKVFNRLKIKLKEELNGESNNSVNNVISQLPVNNKETLNLLNKEKYLELLENCRVKVTKEMLDEAKQLFYKKNNRFPNETEINNILVHLCTNKFISADYNIPSDEEEEYNPNNENDKLLEENDLKEDLIEEEKINQQKINIKPSFAFYSPLVTNNNKTKSFTKTEEENNNKKEIKDSPLTQQLKRKYLRIALQHFKKTHNGRDPNQNELNNLKLFFNSNDKLPIQQPIIPMETIKIPKVKINLEKQLNETEKENETENETQTPENNQTTDENGCLFDPTNNILIVD